MVAFFDFRRLSTSRSVLMGIGIVMIYILHSGKIGYSLYDSIYKYGWIGVDIFFFLSALGLGYSLKKNRDGFIRRRLIRILPTWIIILFLVHIFGLVGLHFMPTLPFHVPQSIYQILSWYTGLGYWIANIFDLSDKTSWYYEWYIPTLLLFYLVTPFLYKRTNKTIIILLVILLITGQLAITNYNTNYLVLSITRVPIFLMGILFFRFIDNKNERPRTDAYIFFLLILFGIGINILNFVVVVEKEYKVLFFIPCLCLLLSYIVQKLNLTAFFSFLGGISLELYLIHLYRRPHYLMSFVCDNTLFVIISTFLLCTISAYLLQKMVSVVNNKLLNNV